MTAFVSGVTNICKVTDEMGWWSWKEREIQCLFYIPELKTSTNHLLKCKEMIDVLSGLTVREDYDMISYCAGVRKRWRR